MSDIVWPERYAPAAADNHVSNEVTVVGLSVTEVWSQLNNTAVWPSYYSNVADVRFRDGSGPELSPGARFRFISFSLPIEAEVTEYEPPAEGKPGRIAWHGWVEGSPETRLDMHRAWLFEDLPDGSVRIVTQETQIGRPAREVAQDNNNPMLSSHQEWVEGLARSAAQNRDA